MRHYHVEVTKGTTKALHSITSLRAMDRIIDTWLMWADEVAHWTCHKRGCHPLNVN